MINKARTIIVTIVAVIAAAGSTITLGGLTMNHLANRKAHLNGTQYVSLERYEEYMLRLDERHDLVMGALAKIDKKVDELGHKWLIAATTKLK